MPRITFVNEHREVEVERGRLISDVAADLGIAVVRAEFTGTRVGDSTVWIDGAAGCVSAPTWYERWIKGCKGQRRLANRARVEGDCKVWTQQGIGSRAGVSRTLDPPTRAGEDGSAQLDHANSPVGTAWNPYGHPKTIGSGTREPPVYEPPVKKGAAKKAAAAKPAAGDDAKAKAAALAKAEAAKKAKAEAKPKEEAKPEADAKPKEEAKPKAEAKPKEEVKPEADAKPKEEAKPKAEAKPKEEARPKEEAKSKDEAKPEDG